jgi:hypothetical protein
LLRMLPCFMSDSPTRIETVTVAGHLKSGRPDVLLNSGCQSLQVV